MNKRDLIITVAAVSFRVWGFIMCISAFIYFLHWESALSASNTYKAAMTAEGKREGTLALLHVIIALLFFTRTLPLARLVCRGLEHEAPTL